MIADSIDRLRADQLTPDVESAAYQHGYEQAFSGRKFRNPCSGNPQGTHQHWLGFHAGELARAAALAIEAEDAAREAFDHGQFGVGA